MTLFIAGLPADLYDQELKELFEEVGTVHSAKVILDRETGQSRCFGYVEMPNTTEANKAIAEFNGMRLDDKVLTVKIAEDRRRPATSNKSTQQGNSQFKNKGRWDDRKQP